MQRSLTLRNKHLLFFALMLLIAASLFGCGGGDDGATGPQGPEGPAGPPGPGGTVNMATISAADMKDLRLVGEVTNVTIASPPVVNFTVTNINGLGVTGLGAKNVAGTALNYLRFTIAKLVPGTAGGPDEWVNYMVTATSRPTTETTGTLVDHGNGSYTYTFVKNITDPAQTGGVTYQPALTHRLAIQVSGSIPGSAPAISIPEPINIIHDFVPAGGPVTTTREITIPTACNDCHGKIGVTTPHGGRVDTRYCVVCHNEQRAIGRTEAATTATGYSGTTYMINGKAVGNFVSMVHRIHMGNRLTKTGYNYADVLFNDVTYPQDQRNCRKCHRATPATPQADNWMNRPSRVACGACHDSVNFATGVNHAGGVRTDDAQCQACHTAADIEANHTTEIATQFNPNVPAGAVNFKYEVSSLTVNASNQPVIKFRILSGVGAETKTAVTFPAFTAGATTLLPGFTGSPSFLVAYAMPQDSLTTMIDFNNLGKSAAQPTSVSILNVWDGTKGTLTGPDGTGNYTATLTTAAAAFPAGAKLRTVALQGYFTQVTPAVARHTISAVANVSGEARRSIVDPIKCGNCHEWFEGHGGNRVIGAETTGTIVCTLCHVPNLTTSGRGGNPANMSAANKARMTADGYNPENPATYPEATDNFKDMIHGIHASHFRGEEFPFQFVRDRGASGLFYYNWSEVKFPGVLNECLTCHKPGTFSTIPANALATAIITQGAAGSTVAQARASVPNANDIVSTPWSSTCAHCHASANAAAHMAQNGGLLNVPRSSTTGYTGEQCAICHSAGKVADITTIHK